MAFFYGTEKFETRDEFIYRSRGFREIETDEELVAYAEKVSGGFQYAGWKHKFTEAWLSDYALEEPYRSLTEEEFKRLKDIQKRIIAEEKAKDEARGWKLIETLYWADNSVEEVWQAEDGEKRTVMVVHPHGDTC